MTEKTIYAKWVACALRRRHFRILRTEVNPNRPQFDCWVFEDTPELEEALTEITQRR